MDLSERAEEILEILWVELVEKKKGKCDVGIFKEDEVVKELLDLSYIKVEVDQISLTNKGKEEARCCIRRHRLSERLLTDVLYFKGKSWHEASCKFEHLLHRGLDDNVCTLLGHPRTCPHGRSIPEGKCCRRARRRFGRLVMPLTELKVNKKAKICHLQTKGQNIMDKIIAIGALPGNDIILTQKFPSYVLKIGKSKFAIDKSMASCIYVRMV